MAKLSGWKMATAIFLLYAATEVAAPAQTFTTLFNFDGINGGEPSYGSLVQGHDGNLYGTTATGGTSGLGTVFRITPGGTLTTLHSFVGYPVEGQNPYAGLALGTDGNYYGTTGSGGSSSNCRFGCGTVYKITSAGALTTLHSFDVTEGSTSMAQLVQATDGNFYGTTSYGGDLTCDSPNGCGTVFNVTPSGVLTVLHTFEGTGGDGKHPYPAPVQAMDGNLYGTTFEGGTHNGGTVYKITPTGKMTTIYSFPLQGNLPEAGLIQGPDGNLYGTASEGGHGDGTVFTITPTGKVTTLYFFCSQTNCTDGGFPYAGLVLATDGNFYGTTFYGGAAGNYGTVFKITSAGMLTTLHSFDNADGALPFGGLIQSTNGILYGAPTRGGPSNFGSIFSLSVSLSPFVTFVRAAGKVGQTGGILGQGFTGTTSVSLNGIPASYRVVSDTYIKATVPPGATTGYVTVTTPSATLTSNVPFHVIK